MELNNKQSEGLRIAVNRYRLGEPYTYIAGYAGTGKSTLVKFLIDALEIDPELVCYATFTGKASLVLRNKGNANAMTLHKLLYNTFQAKDGRFVHRERPRLDIPFKIIVIDEVSMVPGDMWDLALKHGIHVIALGDPGQLPPIGSGNTSLGQPHVFLDEVVRQAQDSGIIRLATEVREQGVLNLTSSDDVRVVPRSAYDPGMMLWCDQAICGKNTTRRSLNDGARQMLYGVDVQKMPVPKDKLICTQNDWDFVYPNGNPLVNGTIGSCNYSEIGTFGRYGGELYLNFQPDEEDAELGRAYTFHADKNLFLTGQPTLNQSNFRTMPKNYRPKKFEYGYAITCHKSQGSEYGKVLVFEECLNYEQHRKWLYTAITRAVDKLVVVKAN